MSATPDLQCQRRREEADLLVCRLLSDLTRLRRDLAELRQDAMNAELMARDPSRVADELSQLPSPLMHYDLQRLLDLVRKGF